MKAGLTFWLIFILDAQSTRGAKTINGFGLFEVFNGKVCGFTDRVITVNTFNPMACATVCLTNIYCRSFFYSQTAGQCYGCRHVSNGRGLETESNTVYFIRIDGAVVLAASSSSVTEKGLVLVWHGGQWGTVCNDNWETGDTHYTANNADVLRKSVGFNRGTAHQGVNSPFSLTDSEGVPILMDGVKCTGTESNLLQCPFEGFGSPTDCDHDEDVGVYCA